MDDMPYPFWGVPPLPFPIILVFLLGCACQINEMMRSEDLDGKTLLMHAAGRGVELFEAVLNGLHDYLSFEEVIYFTAPFFSSSFYIFKSHYFTFGAHKYCTVGDPSILEALD